MHCGRISQFFEGASLAKWIAMVRTKYDERLFLAPSFLKKL